MVTGLRRILGRPRFRTRSGPATMYIGAGQAGLVALPHFISAHARKNGYLLTPRAIDWDVSQLDGYVTKMREDVLPSLKLSGYDMDDPSRTALLIQGRLNLKMQL